jgi:5-methylcytosine-specific restriction endonuclease McrA
MQHFPQLHPCPECGRGLAFTARPDTQHWGEIRCPEHGHRWIPKPDAARKTKRKTNFDLISSLPEYMQGYCWACLREKQLLRSLRPSVSLQVHHIVEVKNGGTDVRDNLMLLCAECHAEVHRRREAFDRYKNTISEAA